MPILRRFLEEEPKPVLLVIMLQREVADNIAAAPGKMGFLSVATQYYAKCSKVCNAPPAAFRPQPKVTSSVLRLDMRSQPAVDLADPQAFFTLVRAGFSAPRKQLRNSISQGLKKDPAEVESMLEVAGLDGQRRAQTVSIEEWAHLYRAWEEQGRVDCSGVC